MKSILIADGNECVAEMFAYVFARHDWNATRYSDGKRAGEELRGRAHYDAVLVSYRFDGIDGVELIRLIRALDHRKDIADSDGDRNRRLGRSGRRTGRRRG